MAVRRIVVADEPILREKSKKVKHIADDVQQLIDDMVETLRAAPGLGLAAPQVGVSQRVVVMEVPVREEEEEPVNEEARERKRRTRLHVLINPEITYLSEETICTEEGCLSIPGYVGDVERAAEATVRYLNRAGRRMRLDGSGLLARVIQHEIDHLDGILYTDRLTSLESLRPVKAGTEEEAEVEAAKA